MPAGYPAALADIRVGDQLIEAEGTDVTKASANLVVTIFKSVHLADNLCSDCPISKLIDAFNSSQNYLSNGVYFFHSLFAAST